MCEFEFGWKNKLDDLLMSEYKNKLDGLLLTFLVLGC